MKIVSKATKAFTLVELMVVIVVIAILASITLVVYPNVQDNAKQAKTISAFRQYEELLKSYKAANGYYPPTQTLNNGGAVATNFGNSYGIACLGTTYVADGTFSTNQCATASSLPGFNASTTPSINTALQTQNNVLPDPVGKTVTGTGGSTGTLSMRGVLYYSQQRRDGTSQNTFLFFAPPDGKSCADGNGGTVMEGVNLPFFACGTLLT